MFGAIVSVAWVLLYRFVPVPGTMLMGLRSLEGQRVVEQWTPIDEISPFLVQAVLAGEDSRFCHHFGFDFAETDAAIHAALAGKRLRGASTITQQTAKNVFLWPSRDPVRKLVEVWFAGLEELLWSKRRIMEVYLNVAEWGDGRFGASAAVLPSPNRWSANPPGPFVSRRAALLQARMELVQRQGLDACVFPTR